MENVSTFLQQSGLVAAFCVAWGPTRLHGPLAMTIPETQRRTVAVKLRLPAHVADALRALARFRGLSVSALVAELVKSSQ